MHTNRNYRPEDLFRNSEYQALANETAELFTTAIPHETPQEMRAYLEQDIFIFSQLKTHTQLTEARQYLKDNNGNITPYHAFEQKVLKLNKQYNNNYLEAEYEFAVHSSQSAANWANLQNDTNRYWLEYRTAGDERVRANHQTLAGVCLPKNDPFWQEFYPPNGWRCRCVAVEVLARDYTKSDSKKAIQNGKGATSQIGKNGKNKLEMFRFNPGHNKKVFPPNNSYTKVVGADKVKKSVEKIIDNKERDYEILNKSAIFKEGIEYMPGDVLKAYPKMDIEKKNAIYMYTDMHYLEINKFNRGQLDQIEFYPEHGISKEFYKTMTKTINAALDEIPDRFEGEVFRGTNLKKNEISAYQKAYEKGTPHSEKSFMSTTYDKNESFDGNVQFKIKTKNGAVIEKVSNVRKEKEVLFKANQQFKVTNFTEYDGAVYYIELEEI